MNVQSTSRKELGPLLQASKAEGFVFVSRLLAELAEGVYETPGNLLLGAYEEDDLLGVCGLTPDPYLGVVAPPVGRVRHLYVLPDFRRAGVGRALVDAIVTAARPHYARLRLRTNTARGRAFYIALGFTETPEPDPTHVLDFKPDPKP